MSGGWGPRLSGVRVEFAAFAPLGRRLRSVEVGGKPLRDEAHYTFAGCERAEEALDVVCRLGIIKKLNPVLLGWSGYFRTGNASDRFVSVDRCVVWRLKKLLLERKGRHLKPGEVQKWHPGFFENHGLVRAHGPNPLPGSCVMRLFETPPVSRMREIRTYGLNGGLASNFRFLNSL